ncbi:MAG: hypothetical protein WCL27_15645 [Betaproteobacteria bacterium]
MHHGKLKQFIASGLCASLLALPVAHADSARPGGAEVGAADLWAFKLTPSYYATTNVKDAFDVNLRANHGANALWLGHYRRGDEFEQTRAGYEYTYQNTWFQLVPSLQVASRGFTGGSLNARIGDEVYALIGYGRTNAKDYYNLNFDPNDSVVYGLGTRLLPKSNLSLFTVRDNRLHTEQHVTHAVWRYQADDHQRWTLDLSTKKGRATPDDDSVSGNALSLTYDNRDVFLRVAFDRKVNFTNEDQTRLSIGGRF